MPHFRIQAQITDLNEVIMNTAEEFIVIFVLNIMRCVLQF